MENSGTMTTNRKRPRSRNRTGNSEKQIDHGLRPHQNSHTQVCSECRGYICQDVAISFYPPIQDEAGYSNIRKHDDREEPPVKNESAMAQPSLSMEAILWWQSVELRFDRLGEAGGISLDN